MKKAILIIILIVSISVQLKAQTTAPSAAPAPQRVQEDTVTLRMPKSKLQQLYTQFGNPAAGSSFVFVLDNTASTSAGAITIALGTGMTSGVTPGLTVPIGKSQTYIVTFQSTTTATMGQIN